MIIEKERIPVKEILLFGFLPGVLKNFVYRLRGYKIGKKVSIGFGAVICGKNVSVGDYTRIGFFTIIRGKEITIGSHVNIGATTFLDTPYMEIGDDSKINEQVFIGGLQLHDSKFSCGKNCQIQQFCFINPAKSITIGDDTSIGGHGLLFGHNSWLNQFEGYVVDFESIEIGSNVGISWRSFLLPGTKIGDGSVIAPNSLVNKTIPPLSLAAGYPARVISKAPNFPKKVSEEQKGEMFENIINEMIAYFNGSGLTVTRKFNQIVVTQVKKRLLFTSRKIWYCGIESGEIGKLTSENVNSNVDVFISLKTIPKETRKTFNSQGVMWLDIEEKERPLFWNDLGDEIALFFKRYGVRFNRVEE